MTTERFIISGLYLIASLLIGESVVDDEWEIHGAFVAILAGLVTALIWPAMVIAKFVNSYLDGRLK